MKGLHQGLLTAGCCALLAVSQPVQADVARTVNALRNSGCGVRLPALKSNAELLQAATALSRSTSTHVRELARKAGFAATRISTLHFSGASDAAQLSAMLKQQCKLLVDAEWTHLASVERGDETWLVFATQQVMPTDKPATAKEVLRLVNQARASARRCGAQRLPAVASLQLNAKLSAAAQQHADDMARGGFLEHVGSDGSSAAQRATRQEYKYALIGENIAAGPGTAPEVVAGWLKSPGHCANLMNARFTEMGLAFAINTHDEFSVYWAQVFGVLRP